MNKKKTKINKRKYSLTILIVTLIGIFVFSMVLRLFTINEIGRTWDEPLYIEQGYRLVEMMKKGDFDNSYFYTTYDHPPLVKYLYGAAAHFDVKNILPNGEALFQYDYTAARILSAIMFSLGVVIVVLIGWQFISPRVGFFAGIILSMLPFSLGLSQLVTAESMKIFIYPLTVYSYLFLVKKYSHKRLIIAAILTGIALQIKQSNVLLIPLLGLIYVFYYKFSKKQIEYKKIFINLFLVSVISIVVFVLIWPQFAMHYKEVQALHSHFWDVQFSSKPWQITLSPPEIFFGRLMLTPVFYYVVYLLISIPVIILAFFFFGAKKIYATKDWILFSIILWFLVPFVMSIYSWRQHGLRYIIEIYPAIALIAAFGYEAFISKFTRRAITKVLFFLPLLLYLALVLWQIKPYYLDYFNEVVGGTNTVYNHRIFQQGWWGQGSREAGYYLKDHAEKGAYIGLAISPDHVFPQFDTFHYKQWSSKYQYDYVVVNHYHIIRDKFDDSPIRKKYNLIYEAKADDATLFYIYKKK